MDATGVAPGPMPAQMELADVRRAMQALGDEGLVETLEAWVAHQWAVDAMVAAVMVEVHERVTSQGYPISGADQTVAAITTVSSRSAGRAVEAAQTVCADSAVWAALLAGRIDRARARAIVDGLRRVPDADRDELVAKALDYAQGHTAYQTRRRVLRLLIDYDPELGPEEVERRRAKAWDSRHVRVHPCAYGMAELSGYVPAGTARVLMEALDAVARDYHDERTLDQKRVDALAQILAQNTRLDIRVDVSIPADTLAGLRDSGASVAGYGPVDADDARALALHEDARWRRLVTDPVDGALLAMSTGEYRIPRRMKAAVRARDRYCRFPGCTTQARYTDTDHVVPWPAGPTRASNLAPGCRCHHRVKTFSGWRCELRDDGAMVWTSPLGTHHVTHPWDYNDPAW